MDLKDYFQELDNSGFKVFRCWNDGNIWATDDHIAIIAPAGLADWNCYFCDRYKPRKEWAEVNDQRVLTAKAIGKALNACPQDDVTEDRYVECAECGSTGRVKWRYTGRDGKEYEDMHECPVCHGYCHRYETVETGEKTASDAAIIKMGNLMFSAAYLKMIQRVMAVTGEDSLRITHTDGTCRVFSADNGVRIVLATVAGRDKFDAEAELLPF